MQWYTTHVHEKVCCNSQRQHIILKNQTSKNPEKKRSKADPPWIDIYKESQAFRFGRRDRFNPFRDLQLHATVIKRQYINISAEFYSDLCLRRFAVFIPLIQRKALRAISTRCIEKKFPLLFFQHSNNKMIWNHYDRKVPTVFSLIEAPLLYKPPPLFFILNNVQISNQSFW